MYIIQRKKKNNYAKEIRKIQLKATGFPRTFIIYSYFALFSLLYRRRRQLSYFPLQWMYSYPDANPIQSDFISQPVRNIKV